MINLRSFSITTFLFLVSLLVLVTNPATAEEIPASSDNFTEVTMRITHRIYPSFADSLSVALGEYATIGDTEFSFEVVDFLADFGIKTDGTVVSRSSIPHNPAFQVVVFEEDEEIDRHWAFFGTGKPHYQRDSLLAFEILTFSIEDKEFTQAVPRKDSSR